MIDEVILLAHGAGGVKSAELLREFFLPAFRDPVLAQLGDAAVLPMETGRVAMTTDAYVITPLEFPGGNIGRMAVCGTVNDLAAAGAMPYALSAAFILEEGLPVALLRRVVVAMAETACEAGVAIVAGDTKVVPRGSADQLFITTTGLGVVPDGCAPAPHRAAPGDVVLVSGTLADHGMAIMTQREGLRFGSALRSDCAPLAGLVAALRAAVADIHCLRDPTRGGLAAVANELATASQVCLRLDESRIPVGADVRVACDLLGIDPLHVANEGKMIAVVSGNDADAALAAWRAHPLGAQAAIIGEVLASPAARVHLRTPLGSLRILDVPTGELLPRIC